MRADAAAMLDDADGDLQQAKAQRMELGACRRVILRDRRAHGVHQPERRRRQHQAAIDMAKIVLANGKDVATKKLAQEVVAAQEREIATIDAWLKKMGK